MKKYIVLSVNSNVDYLYFTPLTIWAWRYFGWEVIVFYNNSLIINRELEDYVFESCPAHQVHTLSPITGYRSDTITQISRLYGACVLRPTDYVMTGDIDMIPLSDYWKVPVYNQDTCHSEYMDIDPTVWGHDLTGYGHYPICYIGMTGYKWNEVMRLNIPPRDYNALIKRDLDTLPQAKDLDFYRYWFTDQDLITQRLKEYGTSKIEFINRGQYANGYAKGRVDRGAWTLDHEQFIDAHLFQQTHHSDEKIRKTFELLETVWPNEDFQWFRDYTVKFKELAK